MTSMLESALTYARLGWQVLPCRPGVKVPLTAHGVKDATTGEDTIRAWWVRWPSANIAIACGKTSGIYVVDIDIDATKGVDGWKSLKEFPDLPATVRQDTPRGGAHFIYQSETPPINKNGFRPGIDIRGEGYYIMAPPSIHPNGKKYVWTHGAGPGEIELAEYPNCMKPPERVPLPWQTQVKPVVRPVRSAGNDVIDRARDYLAECEPSVDGQSGGAALLWAARALVVGFELDTGTAINLLWSDFNPRCSPPYEQSNAAHQKQYHHKIDQALKTPGEKPRGWLLEENGFRPSEAELTFGRQIQADLLASSMPKQDSVVTSSSPLPVFDKPSKDYPEWILQPPGFVGQLCEWMNETAGNYQPLFSLGCALTAAGALMGRKIRDHSNGRTNIFMMGVGKSSSGKDHPGKCIRELFTVAGATSLLGGSRVTSDSAIELALSVHPAQLFTWDEVGHMFAAIKQAGAGSGGAAHLTTIVPALMELYSTAGNLYIGKQKAQEELRRIDQPHICIWGCTSPDVLFAGLSTSELRDGWLGRVITLISDTRPKHVMKEYLPPPDNLVQLTQAWMQRMIPPPDGAGDILGASTCHQITLQTNAAAMQVFEQFGDQCYNKILKCEAEADMTQYLWGKALQNARRVALVIAAGCAFDGAEIQEFHAKYACEFIRLGIESFRTAIASSMADNVWEADKQRIMRIIESAGRKGLPKSLLTRKTAWCKDRKVRNAYLEDMEEGGMISMKKHPVEKVGWVWKCPYGWDNKETE